MTARQQPQPAQPSVPPGTGWPEDPATAQTPVAGDPATVRDLAASAGSLAELAARESVCRACPRLVAWREQVAVARRRAYADERYWGRPVPAWGDDRPRVLILGLAPAAHGGNRTGRIFTGDRSGDVLFASLYRSGLAAQPTSVRAGDGQRLIGARMVASVRCAPPANKPDISERDACAPWLTAELALSMADLRVIVCLGGFAWQVVWPQLAAAGLDVPRPRPAFGHGAEVLLPRPPRSAPAAGRAEVMPPRSSRSASAAGRAEVGLPRAPRPGSAGGGADGGEGAEGGAGLLVLGCYHPSQQNTFTGRVNDAMLDAVFTRARTAAAL